MVRDRLFALAGLTHMGLAWGLVSELLVGPEGQWTAEPVARLSGDPVAVAGDEPGYPLFLLTEPLVADPSCQGSFLVVRVSSDGRVEAVE